MEDFSCGKVYAWGDESVRVSADPSVYLLAATMVFPGESVETLSAIKPKGAVKLHWRDMTRKLQAKSLDALAEIRHSTTIVVGAPLPKRKQERGRRKCLECLLPELESLGVNMFVLESRDDYKNKKDVELFLALRRKGVIRTIDIAHRSAESEPRLWIPDQILGAYGDVLCDNPGAEYWSSSWRRMQDCVKVLQTTI